MSQEDKTVETTTPSTEENKPEGSMSEEDATKQTTKEQVPLDPSQEPTDDQDTPDYEAALKAEEQRIEQLRKAKRKREKLEKEETTDTSLQELEALKQEIADLKSQMTGVVTSSRSSILEKHAHNDAEKKLIEFHLEHSIKSSGNFEQDVLRAKALANAKRVQQVNQELKKSLQTQPGNGDSSSHRPMPDVQAPKGLSQNDIAHLKARGLYDEYIKKYSN